MKQNLTNSGSLPQLISPETGLTAVQEKCAALIASGTSITDAARELGISRGSVYRWQSLLPFKCYLNALKQDVKAAVEGRVLGLHAKALESVEGCLDSPNEAVRLKAATWILDKASQLDAGAANIREALKAEASEEVGFNPEAAYKKKLQKYGLEE